MYYQHGNNPGWQNVPPLDDLIDQKITEVKRRAALVIADLEGDSMDKDWKRKKAADLGGMPHEILKIKIQNVRDQSNTIEAEIQALPDVDAVLDYSIPDMTPAPDGVPIPLTKVEFMNVAAEALGGNPAGVVRFDTVFMAAKDSTEAGVPFAVEQFMLATVLERDEVAPFLDLMVGYALGDLTQAERDAVIDAWPSVSGDGA